MVAVSDWMRAVPDQIAPFVHGDWSSLGTDGFGMSDTRAALRRHFRVDPQSIVVRVLERLAHLELVDRARPAEASEAIPPRFGTPLVTRRQAEPMMKAPSSRGPACGARRAPPNGCGAVMTNDRIVVYGHLNSPSSYLASIRATWQPMIMSTECVELGVWAHRIHVPP